MLLGNFCKFESENSLSNEPFCDKGDVEGPQYAKLHFLFLERLLSGVIWHSAFFALVNMFELAHEESPVRIGSLVGVHNLE